MEALLLKKKILLSNKEEWSQLLCHSFMGKLKDQRTPTQRPGMTKHCQCMQSRSNKMVFKLTLVLFSTPQNSCKCLRRQSRYNSPSFQKGLVFGVWFCFGGFFLTYCRRNVLLFSFCGQRNAFLAYLRIIRYL